MSDPEQLLIWKASLVLVDGRMSWPRQLKKAIRMIEARDPQIVKQQEQIRSAGWKWKR